MIDLPTTPINEVPQGGVFIYQAIGAWHVYRRTSMYARAVNEYIIGELIYSTRTGTNRKGKWNYFDYDTRVVYTGITLEKEGGENGEYDRD